MTSVKIRGKEKLSKLEGMAVYLRYLPLFLGNEIIQQVKHLYYHIGGASHQRVPLDSISPDTYFDILSCYTKEDSILHSSFH